MTLQEFETKYNGKGIDFDGYYGDQCVDLFQFYNKEVIGAAPCSGNAIDIQYTYPKAFYSWVANTPTGVPAPGDVLIWGKPYGKYTDSGGNIQYAGHIAIFLRGDANNFVSLDQNWPAGSIVHEQAHTYDGVVGWLHPQSHATTGAIYKGIDTTNIDSVKVCIDAWFSLTHGEYVAAADVNVISADLGLPNGSNKDAIVAAINKLKADVATKDTTITNLNKQIPTLEGEKQTLQNTVDDLTQKLAIAQQSNTDSANYKALFEQAETDLKTIREQFSTYQKTTNQRVAQLQNTSALTMNLGNLWKIAVSRALNLS